MLAPDLYYWGSRLRCLFTTLRAFTAGVGQPFDDLRAARTWLANHDECTGRAGVIGFCMGGGFALLLATTGDYDASSVNYGTLPPEAMQTLADACPIVASYGGKDRSLRGVPGQLEEVLTAHGVDHDIHVYPYAGHGFLNNHAPGETPVWAVVAGKYARAAYHGPSAADARRRIVTFFDQHLAE